MLMALFRLSRGHQTLSMTQGTFHLLAITPMQACITVLGSVYKSKKKPGNARLSQVIIKKDYCFTPTMMPTRRSLVPSS